MMPYSLSEIYSIEEYRPDYQAAKWFYDNYILTGKGRFIHKDEAIHGNPDIMMGVMPLTLLMFGI